MEKEIMLDEYLTKVDILNDFWTYSKKAKESYCYLKALKDMLVNELYEEFLADKVNKYKNELETVINEFLGIDLFLVKLYRSSFIVI